MLKSNFKSLIVFLIIIAFVQVVGGFFTSSSVSTWYQTLEKPSFNPPDWVFAPVWTTLYIMIAISGWLVWNKLEGSTWQKMKTRAMKVYAWQLAANLIWSIIFFGLRNPHLAFIEIIILAFLIAFTIFRFWNISRPAAWLLAPYLAWVSFASVLNYEIVRLN